jgi:hypothetical protein
LLAVLKADKKAIFTVASKASGGNEGEQFDERGSLPEPAIANRYLPHGVYETVEAIAALPTLAFSNAQIIGVAVSLEARCSGKKSPVTLG